MGTPARRINIDLQRAGSTLRRTGATTVRLRAGITLRLRTSDQEPTFRANPFKKKGKPTWAIVLVILAILAVAGGAAWFFFWKDLGPYPGSEEEDIENPAPELD